MRVFIVVSAVSSPSNWRHEGNILLPSKFGHFLARTGRAHVYFFVPDNGDTSFIQDSERFTVKRCPDLTDGQLMTTMGYVASPSSVMEAVVQYGPDLLFVFNARNAAILKAIFEADSCLAVGRVNIPLVLWDGTPGGLDVLESRGGGGWQYAGGYVSSDHSIVFSKAMFASAFTEVRQTYGFAAAGRLGDKTDIAPAVIDREYMESVVPEVVEKRDTFTVHIGGRWSGTKGYGTVANVVKSLQASGEEMGLLCTGMPSQNSAYLQAKAEMEMETITSLTQEEMWKAVKSCHVAVLSQDLQAVPAMAFEQLALGLPLLVKSSPNLERVMPRYPYVWSNPDELMGLLIYTRDNYQEVHGAASEWFSENWQNFDISLLGPIVDKLKKSLVTVSVPIVFDETGVVDIKSIGSN